MRKFTSTMIIVLVATFSTFASAQHSAGPIAIDGPYSLELPPVSRNGAAYFQIANHGQQPDRLVSAASPIAERAELHTHEMSGGMMKMREVPDVSVPAKASVAFAPGGLHVMLMGLKRPLVAGETFPLTLNFERAGAIVLEVPVRPRGQAGKGGSGDHSGMKKHSGHGMSSGQSQ